MHCCSLLVLASSVDNQALNNIELPPCNVFLAPSTIPGTGFGVFAGCAYKKDELLPTIRNTLLLPKNFPLSQVLRNYVFGYNETHSALTLDYGSVLNHHESANAKAVRFLLLPPGRDIQFETTKDIEAGQELFVRYSDAQWFEGKNITYFDVDYASTMWRPDLHHLPCQKNIDLATGADGKPTFSSADVVSSGTVMDVSPCVKVSIIVVDQFLLWDFVLMDPTRQMVCVPLSYAAQIPTTPNPDLANVNVSLTEHNVTGSANLLVTVVTTQELRPGDFLLRYEAKAFEHDIQVFSAHSRDELKRAVYDCCRDGISSDDNDSSRLHGPIGNWNVSQVTDMSKMFYDLHDFHYTLSNWDVSRVTNMTGMFDSALSFNQSLSNWDVSRVSDMTEMFHVAKAFNQDLSNWNVSHVTDMTTMFRSAKAFNQDLSNWDVSRVIDMTAMFYDATSFNQDLSSWDVSCVTDMEGMFESAESFNQDLSKWDVSRVTEMTGMFRSAKVFNQDLSNWNVSRVTRMTIMFHNATSFNQDLSNWDVSRVTEMAMMFDDATSFNQDVSNWDVSRVMDMGGMFDNATSFNQDVSNWNVSCVTDMGGMFSRAEFFNQDLSNWDVSFVTDMTGMFGVAKSFDQTLCNWDVSHVSDMTAMFHAARSFNQDLSNWDVSRVTDMTGMFDSAVSFNQSLSNWDVSNVSDMNAMFHAARSFNQDLSNWDVSRVVNMKGMFAEASSFQQTLCGEAWVNSKASKVGMFDRSPGSISDTVCAFSPQSRNELKRAVDDCAQLPNADRVPKTKT